MWPACMGTDRARPTEGNTGRSREFGAFPTLSVRFVTIEQVESGSSDLHNLPDRAGESPASQARLGWRQFTRLRH